MLCAYLQAQLIGIPLVISQPYIVIFTFLSHQLSSHLLKCLSLRSTQVTSTSNTSVTTSTYDNFLLIHCYYQLSQSPFLYTVRACLLMITFNCYSVEISFVNHSERAFGLPLFFSSVLKPGSGG